MKREAPKYNSNPGCEPKNRKAIYILKDPEIASNVERFNSLNVAQKALPIKP
jgi:hypothetical protein